MDQRGMSGSVQTVIVLPVALGLFLLLLQWSLVGWADATALAAAQQGAAVGAPVGASVADVEAAAGAVADNGSLTDVQVTVSQTSTEVVTVVSGRAVTVLWPRRVESTVMVPRERLTGS